MSPARARKRRSTARTEGESSTSNTRIREPFSTASVVGAQSPHQLHQLAGVEALLGEVGVGAGLEAAQAVLGAVAGRDDDDRQMGEVLHAAQLAGQLEAVHVRHLDLRT